MSNKPQKLDAPGPFRADQIPPKSRYELSDGHAIYCAPAGGRHGEATSLGGKVLSSYPDLEAVGVDVGFTASSGTLRAPDVAVLPRSGQPGWVQGAPPLAVEYADVGQDEEDLQAKIADLLKSGTRWIWVVRLTGPRRVEVFSPGQPMRLALPGELLEAPGLLDVPLPVEALYQREAADQHTFFNLLRERGYTSLDAVRDEGRAEGREEGRVEGEAIGLEKGEAIGLERGEVIGLERGAAQGVRDAILMLLSRRSLSLTPEERATLQAEQHIDTLKSWLHHAFDVESTQLLFQKDVPGHGVSRG